MAWMRSSGPLAIHQIQKNRTGNIAQVTFKKSKYDLLSELRYQTLDKPTFIFMKKLKRKR